MATCHSLTYIYGELAGDPLDIKMFDFVNWELVESGNDSEETNALVNNKRSTALAMMPTIVRPLAHDKHLVQIHPREISQKEVGENGLDDLGIIKQFPFSSSLQRMSVIVKSLNASHFDLFTKGSPEKVAELSKAETSVYFLI